MSVQEAPGPADNINLRDFHFAVYQFRVGRPNGRAYDFGDPEAREAFTAIRDSLSRGPSSETTRKTYVELLKVETSEKERCVFGILEAGSHGERRAVVSLNAPPENRRTKKTVDRDEAALSKFFFYVFVPAKGSHGVIILQQRGVVVNYTYFSKLLEDGLMSKALAFRPERVAPPEYERAIAEGQLKRVVFTKYVNRTRNMMGFENAGELSEIGKVTITLEPRRGMNIDSFKGLFGGRDGKPHLAADTLDFDPDKASFTFDWNGRPFKAGVDASAHGRPTFIEAFDIMLDDNHLLGEFKAFADRVTISTLT